jgi:MerR family transcriptional regulator, heat shock protein HspR
VKFYTREQMLEIVGIEGGFLVALEREEIVRGDAPEAGVFSELMLERVRVAHELVHELDVNVEGAAIIVRMREELAALRRDVEGLAGELRRLRGRS